MALTATKNILWWGKSDIDYARNRICRQLLRHQGYQIQDFYPQFSQLAYLEASFRRLPKPDLVWVPCFRQRDMKAASQWARKHHVPLLIDPLISAWDKQVFERKKFAPDSRQAQVLKQWESALMQLADVVLVDTDLQGQLFHQQLGVEAEKLFTVYVGAEQPLFQPKVKTVVKDTIDVLFYGSFIELHGVETIIAAAKQTVHYPEMVWTLLGEGKAKQACMAAAASLPNVRFEATLPYMQLPQRIANADMVLGIFGNSYKAASVIPNKVYQALACGKTVITRASDAYPTVLQDNLRNNTGLHFVPAANASALAHCVLKLAQSKQFAQQGRLAKQRYDEYFSQTMIQTQLTQALQSVLSVT